MKILIEGSESFFDKLERQLARTGPDVKKLAAEMFWVMMLCPSSSTIGVDKKVSNIERIWSWSSDSLGFDHKYLTDSVLSGVGSAGQGFNQNYWRELIYFIRVLKAFFSLEDVSKERLLRDGWEFDKWLDSERIPENDKKTVSSYVAVYAFS